MLQTLGPYAAALVTLGGVALTLYITGRRDRERSRLQRLDENRREQRVICSDLLGALNRYVRSVNHMSRPTVWAKSSEDEFKRNVAEINDLESTIDSLLVRARLLVDDLPELVEALNGCHDAFLATSAAGKEAADTAWALPEQRGRRAKWAMGREVRVAEERAIEKLHEFSTAACALHAAAIDALAPTIVKENGLEVRRSRYLPATSKRGRRNGSDSSTVPPKAVTRGGLPDTPLDAAR